MEKDRGFKVMAVIALLIGVLGLSIAYAAYSQTLTINGSGVVNKATWDIHFEDLSAGVATGKAVLATGGKIAISAPTTIAGSLGTLKAPGDSITYTFNVANNGTIPAKITAIQVGGTDKNSNPIIQLTCTKASGGEPIECPSDIKLTLTYTGGTEIKLNDTLAAASGTATKKGLTLKLDWPSSSVAQITEDINVAFKPVTITYGQD